MRISDWSADVCSSDLAPRCGPSCGFVEPGARLALRLGDFIARHFARQVGAALLAFDIAAERGEVEPFMRLDQVDIDPARAGRKRDTENELSTEERRLGKECDSKSRSRRRPEHSKKNNSNKS